MEGGEFVDQLKEYVSEARLYCMETINWLVY
jgi:hypothetical protein